MGARFCFFFAWFLGFLPGVTFSSFPAFLAWARGACLFLVANFLQIVFWLGFLPGVGAPGARQSFVFFGGFQGVFSDFSKLAHVLAHFCHGSVFSCLLASCGCIAWGALPGVSNSFFFGFSPWVVRLGCIAWGQQLHNSVIFCWCLGCAAWGDPRNAIWRAAGPRRAWGEIMK